ncbi:restriction endonuclease subunit S [Paenibacillus polymyxa]|nr:restriction endonuclease subunit S [Paenibacillus polymyxa]
MPTYKLIELIDAVISGEWGQDVGDGMEGIKVIRTTNLSNTGKLDLKKEVVLRNIDKAKVEEKKLQLGDIIIEKSGGSPDQPVGRVVYFEEEELYLCNNFTSVLRPKKELVIPKFLMYVLFNLHRTKKVLKFQNKTTGIINLKLEQYLNQTTVIIPSLEIQSKVVVSLDQAYALIEKRQSQITALDELTQSLFLEMFYQGDTPYFVKIGEIIESIEAGWSVSGEERPKKIDELAVLKISAVTKGYFKEEEYKVINRNTVIKKAIYPKKGDIIFSRANTRELVGASAIVPKDYSDLILPDKLWKINLEKKKITPEYFHAVINTKKTRDKFSKSATGTSGSMLNISMQKFKEVEIPLLPFEKQVLFSRKLNEISKIKEKLIAAQKNIEQMYNSLLHKAFKGELFQEQ